VRDLLNNLHKTSGVFHGKELFLGQLNFRRMRWIGEGLVRDRIAGQTHAVTVNSNGNER
jgi:hypothetical protein